MWVYAQDTGELLREHTPVGWGYSGFELGKNNSVMQAEHNIGPIPCGMWEVGNPTDLDGGPHGPFILPLTPLEGTVTYGRSGFLIHGDSKEHPGEASHGCIILNRTIRNTIATSGDKLLKVV